MNSKPKFEALKAKSKEQVASMILVAAAAAIPAMHADAQSLQGQRCMNTSQQIGQTAARAAMEQRGHAQYGATGQLAALGGQVLGALVGNRACAEAPVPQPQRYDPYRHPAPSANNRYQPR